jgi:hypothetical protein
VTAKILQLPAPRKASAEVHAMPAVEFIAADGHVGIVIEGVEWWISASQFEEHFVRPAFRALAKAWGNG